MVVRESRIMTSVKGTDEGGIEQGRQISLVEIGIVLLLRSKKAILRDVPTSFFGVK